MSVLSDWGPLLNKSNPHSAIISLFMNWQIWKESANALASSDAGHAMKRMASCPYAGISPISSPEKMISLINNLNIFYDTSRPFEQYLRDEREAVIARKTRLQCQHIHKIVPHHCHAKLGMTQSELPCIDSAQRWYRVACLGGMTYCKRYIEWRLAAP
ncbi:hypothetical protein EDD18DRAFT_1347937 [Armillaria luteobubalina]|uniref:Uncharacterized protein n=1 Tax=Armillaria luteobubalina TaxID=153913 RepID=A0AA39QHQ3_9AGAR|nr:hypothetical protein EDD18DRAFT_1347937 [Armillaria luteobubalina]